MKATEFDEKFDNGEDISEFLDYSSATRPGRRAVSFKLIITDFEKINFT
jgi:hypothetical protein